MNFLLPGVTGYGVDKPATPFLFTSPTIRGFKSACHTAARLSDARVMDEWTDLYRSYWACLLDFDNRDRQLLVLGNHSYPFLAFCEVPETSEGETLSGRLNEPLPFMDWPKLASTFEQLGDWLVVPLDVLRTPITHADTSRLGAYEQEAIDYFRTQRVGDVIFNLYD